MFEHHILNNPNRRVLALSGGMLLAHVGRRSAIWNLYAVNMYGTGYPLQEMPDITKPSLAFMTRGRGRSLVLLDEEEPKGGSWIVMSSDKTIEEIFKCQEEGKKANWLEKARRWMDV